VRGVFYLAFRFHLKFAQQSKIVRGPAHGFDDDLLCCDVRVANIRHFHRDFFRNGCHLIVVAMHQIVRINGNAANVNRDVNLRNARIAVRANRTVREHVETDLPRLLNATSCPICHQLDLAERFARRTHDFTECHRDVCSYQSLLP